MTMSECEDGDDEDLLLTRKAYRQAVATSPGYAKNASFFMPRNLAAIKLANEYLQQVLATNWVGRCYLSAAPAALRNMAGRSYCPQLGADARFQGRLASTDASSVGVA